jgi:ABC-type polar amino acid transport system ATPase subunit
MTAELAIAAKGVNKWFGAYHALREVSFGLALGEKIVLCGPSGSGKSTLIRCINGLETPDSGEIAVCGHRADGTAASAVAITRATGMVFQNFNLFPHLTVLRNLTLGPVYARGEAERAALARAAALLERVQMSEHAEKFPGQLSGGQRQRVAIARALMLEPQVLLFDEPTSALDPEMVHEVLVVMEQLAEAGQSMIVVTHEMGFARRVADLVVFMDAGEIVEAAPPDAFFAAPQTPRAKAFIGQIFQGSAQE